MCGWNSAALVSSATPSMPFVQFAPEIHCLGDLVFQQSLNSVFIPPKHKWSLSVSFATDRGVSRNWPDIFYLQTITLAVGWRMDWMGTRTEARRWFWDYCWTLVRQGSDGCHWHCGVIIDIETKEDFGAIVLNSNCPYKSFEELFKSSEAPAPPSEVWT